MGWEKIFANNADDKRLISKIYKQRIQLGMKRTNYPVEKGRKPNDISPKKTVPIATRYMRRCSTSLLEKYNSEPQ